MAVKTRAKRLNYGRNHLPTKLPYNSNIYMCVFLFTFKVFENCVAYNNNDIDDGLYAGLFELEELEELDLIKDALSKIKFRKLSLLNC